MRKSRSKSRSRRLRLSIHPDSELRKMFKGVSNEDIIYKYNKIRYKFIKRDNELPLGTAIHEDEILDRLSDEMNPLAFELERRGIKKFKFSRSKLKELFGNEDYGNEILENIKEKISNPECISSDERALELINEALEHLGEAYDLLEIDYDEDDPVLEALAVSMENADIASSYLEE